ncbi:MAG: UDP-glucose 6-dehydrogenase [Planctomycetota bacterium]|nr:MAG: UDP-glucose 6-dehydrogenase [Planctomycetota bacterium]
MKIAVVGTGYVGLVVGTCFAETGHRVTCVDIDETKIAMLHRGEVPIYEPGLKELIDRNVEEERLLFTTNVEEAIAENTTIFIAVGTPPGEDGSADLQYVLAVARSIGKHMTGYRLVVDKSTVPVGTSRLVTAEIAKHSDHPFDVVSNPEFLKEGQAIDDFMKPNRVVIGTDEPRAGELMKELYAPFVRTGKPLLVMDPESAELCKYASNAMLATRISFMNEIARICDLVGADFSRVREAVGTDSRIGMPFLFAGVGYGGSCFPKDVRAIQKTALDKGYEFKILDAVEAVNAQQKLYLYEKVMDHFQGDLSGKHFAVWGLSFKPRTDDMREAPALTIIDRLLAQGATVTATDPEAMGEAKRILGDRIRYAKKPIDAAKDADALLLVTEWSEFRHPDFEELKTALKSPIIFDGRNIFSPKKMRGLGFTYYGIGVDRN